MKRETKQKIAYVTSSILTFVGLIGILSATGNMDQGNISCTAGTFIALACIAVVAVFGRLSEEIYWMRERDKARRILREPEVKKWNARLRKDGYSGIL